MNFVKVGQASRPGDTDPDETAEWLAALESVVRAAGEDRAEFLLSALDRKAKELGVGADLAPYLPYRNSIPLERQPPFPGDIAMEERITAIIRWNALAIETGEQRVWEVKGLHVFAEGLPVVGRKEHLDSIDEPRIGHSDLGCVYRVLLPHEAIDDFDVGVLREINRATAEHIVGIPLHLNASGLQRFAAGVA